MKLVSEEVNKLRTNTTKILDHISIILDSFDNIIMSSAVVSDEVPATNRSQNHHGGSNLLSNEMGIWLSEIADRLTIEEQNPISIFTPHSRSL